VEADMVSFFDSLDRPERKKRLEMRVADGSLMRLIGKGLHGGCSTAKRCLSQRGYHPRVRLSPLLGNVSLHDGLDLWCETAVKSRLRGKRR